MAQPNVSRFRWRFVVLFVVMLASFFLLMPGCLGHPPRDCLRDLFLIGYGTAFHMLIEQILNNSAGSTRA